MHRFLGGWWRRERWENLRREVSRSWIEFERISFTEDPKRSTGAKFGEISTGSLPPTSCDCPATPRQPWAVLFSTVFNPRSRAASGMIVPRWGGAMRKPPLVAQLSPIPMRKLFWHSIFALSSNPKALPPNFLRPLSISSAKKRSLASKPFPQSHEESALLGDGGDPTSPRLSTTHSASRRQLVRPVYWAELSSSALCHHYLPHSPPYLG